jgi:survival-of-motor-neuron-related-splicing factor 30
LQWLEVKPTDNEKTKNKKKKLQKSLKSKMRFQRLDQATNERQAGWLDFRKGKGSKKKVAMQYPPALSTKCHPLPLHVF